VGAGVVALIAIGLVLDRDDGGEVVPAGEWADSVCGAVSTWHEEVVTIAEEAKGGGGDVRAGFDRALAATDVMVEGIEDAGVPDTPEGEEAAERLSDWASDAEEALEESEDALAEEPTADDISDAARSIGAVLASGTQTLVEVGRVDPTLAAALRTSSACDEVRESATTTAP
jgi:hypothetical protein